MRKTPTAFALCSIIILTTISIIGSSFTLISPISLELGSTNFRRDVRLVSGDPTFGTYKACIADSNSRGEIYSLNTSVNTSFFYISVTQEQAPGNGFQNDDLTVIQGLDDCAYSGLVNSQLTNQVFGDTVSSDLPAHSYPWNWMSPTYTVWLNNYNTLLTLLYSYDLVVSRLNTTTDGPHSFTPSSEKMDRIYWWELYMEPTSEMFYIVYSLTRDDNSLQKIIIQKCSFNCFENSSLPGGEFGTITANATHWFSCFKYATNQTSDHIVLRGQYMCSMEGQVGDPTVLDIHLTYPMNFTRNAPLFSCMISNTTLILAVSDSNNQLYSLYSLDTANGFAVGDASRIGNLTVMSMTCMDNIILVATRNGIDYWTWDSVILLEPSNQPTSPVSTNPPVTYTYPPLLSTVPYDEPTSPLSSSSPASPPADSVPTDMPTSLVPSYEPITSPTLSATPVADSPMESVVTQPQMTTASNDLSDTNKVLVGVLVGVGVPVMTAAIVLIIMREKWFKKKKKSNDNVTIYTAINRPDKKDPSFDKKMLIPFKQLHIGKAIGSGSFGQVFLGKWRGASVAIKISNLPNLESFLAEATLTLSVPPHPNLVRTYGVCTDSEYPAIVLEYCEGGSLDKIVFNHTLGHKEQQALVLGIAYGLLHLHEHKIVHRDLAARNVLLKKGIPMICDFGMSRALKEEALQGKTFSSIGPIRWMAPESVKDMSYSYKSDVWTFGIVVSEIVNGHEPFDRDNQLDVAMKIRDHGLTPTISEDCDPVLAELMQMCWKVDPDERPTMDEIVVYLNTKLDVSDQ